MKKIYNAIVNYINKRTEILEYKKPCEHDWEIIFNRSFNNKLNPNYQWVEITYRCKKCCKSKKISSE